MQAREAAHSGTHGRIRQHLVTLGGRRPEPHGAFSTTRDRFLRTVIHDGIVTARQLEQSLQECSRTPSKYAWILGADEAMLTRADCAFLAEFGRFPTEDSDFELNGPYQRICRGLEYDWHYYDRQMEALRWDDEGRPYVRAGADVQAVETTREAQVKKGSWWAFSLVLLVGLIGGPFAAAGIVRNMTHDLLASVFMFGAIWVVSFAGLLALAMPRQAVRRSTRRQCGRCGRDLVRKRQVLGCPVCGLAFEPRPAGEPSSSRAEPPLAIEPARG